MIKVLIKESDLIFLQGMKDYLSDFFWRTFRRNVEFATDYTSENIADADVIILSMFNGEGYTCFPELRARRKGIIIGVVNENDEQKKLLNCLEDIIYITRRESLSETTHKIYSSWRNLLINDVFTQYTSCRGCKCSMLSLQQRNILEQFCKGSSIQQIANGMKLSHKTVAAHKYIVMRKFGLKNDYELLRLFDKLEERNKIRRVE